jgi:cell division protein FtsL
LRTHAQTSVSWLDLLADSEIHAEDMHEHSAYAKTKPAALKDFSACQKVFVVLLAIVLLYFVSFIVYMALTWNKVRINEYA